MAAAAAWMLCVGGGGVAGIERDGAEDWLVGIAGVVRRRERALSMDWSIFRSRFLTLENVSGEVDIDESSVTLGLSAPFVRASSGARVEARYGAIPAWFVRGEHMARAGRVVPVGELMRTSAVEWCRA